MIETFIRESLRQPWQPGKVDCLMVLADWATWNGYADPVSEYRGTYDDEEGYQAIVASAGGVVPLIQSVADKIGIVRVDQPSVGNIAVIGSPSNIKRQWGAIWDGNGWRVRFVDSYPVVSARSLAIWSL